MSICVSICEVLCSTACWGTQCCVLCTTRSSARQQLECSWTGNESLCKRSRPHELDSAAACPTRQNNKKGQCRSPGSSIQRCNTSRGLTQILGKALLLGHCFVLASRSTIQDGGSLQRCDISCRNSCRCLQLSASLDGSMGARLNMRCCFTLLLTNSYHLFILTACINGCNWFSGNWGISNQRL